MPIEFKTGKTSVTVLELLRNLNDKTGEPMYKIQERLLIKEHIDNNIELPDGIRRKNLQ